MSQTNDHAKRNEEGIAIRRAVEAAMPNVPEQERWAAIEARLKSRGLTVLDAVTTDELLEAAQPGSGHGAPLPLPLRDRAASRGA